MVIVLVTHFNNVYFTTSSIDCLLHDLTFYVQKRRNEENVIITNNFQIDEQTKKTF